jgi:hypothetical protein
MATDKTGMWFLELILNILLLAGVALVTFAARAEQERGLAVTLFAAVSPSATRTAVDAPGSGPSSIGPNALPAPAVVPGVDPHVVTKTVGDTVKNSTRSFDQAWGALQLWAAGLDGRISGDELKKIQDSIADGWNNTQGARDYLRSVNDRINAGQADQVVQEALRVISQQADEKKVMVMRSVADFMKANGVTWEQTQQVMGKWVVQVLKLSPMDVVNFVKSLDK